MEIILSPSEAQEWLGSLLDSLPNGKYIAIYRSTVEVLPRDGYRCYEPGNVIVLTIDRFSERQIAEAHAKDVAARANKEV